MYAGLTHANNDTLVMEYNTYKDACLINIPLSWISIDWRNKSRDARINGIYCWCFAIKWKTNQMATTEIGSILPSPLPSQLLRRISRLIKIDDIFADETSTSLDDSEPDNRNVCIFIANIYSKEANILISFDIYRIHNWKMLKFVLNPD